MLFLDAPDDVLVRRFEGTRRRHPLAARGVEESIADERRMLEVVRGRADVILDTGELNSNQLRQRILELFGESRGAGNMQTSVVSFGYKHGIPLDVDIVFDCRFLPNPYWVESLRPLSGLDDEVRRYVFGQPETAAFLDKVEELLVMLVPAFVREGKSYLTVAMGCTGGRHRSVALAEALVERLAAHGFASSVLPPGRGAVSPVASGPKVVAVGGGHGTAVSLKALRRYASQITAVVSVADDGGSSGRLRQQLDVVALGDLRKCLVALADPSSVLARAFEHRFGDTGELSGHALGNLVLAGLVDATGDLVAGIDAAAELLGCVRPGAPGHHREGDPQGRGRPGRGRGPGGGLGRRAGSGGCRWSRGAPARPPRPPRPWPRPTRWSSAPGRSTPACWPRWPSPGIAEALAAAGAQRVYVCNLFPQVPETEGYDVAAHVAALREHGVDVDVVLWDSQAGLVAGACDRPLVDRRLAGANGLVHDPARLAVVLSDLLA